MKKPALSERELQRVREILSAATDGDWERFKFLSDEPFPNETSMREQFEDSHLKLAKGSGKWEETAAGSDIGDGTRLITVLVPLTISGGSELTLILHTSGDGIGIWVIYDFATLDLNNA